MFELDFANVPLTKRCRASAVWGMTPNMHKKYTKTPYKLLKIILFASVFELLFKHNTPKNVIISEYLLASEYFLSKIQIGYLNAILDKISKLIRK